jgi:hypothetical protein
MRTWQYTAAPVVRIAAYVRRRRRRGGRVIRVATYRESLEFVRLSNDIRPSPDLTEQYMGLDRALAEFERSGGQEDAGSGLIPSSALHGLT